MKKIIRILFVCLFFIALIFIGKNVLKDGKEREYIKSDKYYEENIENININEVNFKFLQVNEVANVNEAFYNKYDSYKEVVVEDNKNYDVFEKYTKVDVAFDQGYSGMRCYLNEDESFGGAYFRYTFEYETNDENHVNSHNYANFLNTKIYEIFNYCTDCECFQFAISICLSIFGCHLPWQGGKRGWHTNSICDHCGAHSQR